jgi:ribA/ribD-fused uncharacterized protein
MCSLIDSTRFSAVQQNSSDRTTSPEIYTMLDRPELCRRFNAGKQFEFLLFWGHQVPEDGAVGPSCRSQWYPASFKIKRVTYATAEHWMMASKATLFGDKAMLKQILVAPDPKSAKALGRKVQDFDETVWKANCRRLVVEGNVAKFSQNKELKKFLLGTGDKVIVEAAPRDCVWGIGLGCDNPRAQDPNTWRGQNLLGFALMDVRDALATKRKTRIT